VISKFTRKIAQADLDNPVRVLALSALLVLLVFALVQDAFGVPLLSVSICIAAIALAFEALEIRIRARGKQIRAEWPTVVESLESAAQSSMSLLESLRDLADSTHLLVAKDFDFVSQLCDRGVGLDDALAQLKPRLGLGICDSTIETMRLVHDSGGQGFQAALRQQRLIIRESNNVAQQIEVKQGWVLGTAKISVAAPWVIVILLASREENAAAYSSIQGSLLLLLGLFASVLAIQLITRIGRVENQTRVFA
jgi:tight adherence protein B